MNTGWLPGASARARIDTLEAELATLRTSVAGLCDRVAAAERDAREVAVAAAAGHRRVAALARMLRAGSGRLEALSHREKGAAKRFEQTDQAIASLRASMLALGTRLDAEAEDARRAATALFERIEARSVVRDEA